MPENDFAAGVALTGGGSNLSGIEKMAKKELGFVSRLAAPRGVLPEESDLSLSTSYGLLLEAKGFAEEETSFLNVVFERTKGILKDLIP